MVVKDLEVFPLLGCAKMLHEAQQQLRLVVVDQCGGHIPLPRVAPQQRTRLPHIEVQQKQFHIRRHHKRLIKMSLYSQGRLGMVTGAHGTPVHVRFNECRVGRHQR